MQILFHTIVAYSFWVFCSILSPILIFILLNTLYLIQLHLSLFSQHLISLVMKSFPLAYNHTATFSSKIDLHKPHVLCQQLAQIFFALYSKAKLSIFSICFLLYLLLFQCTLKFLLTSMKTLSITENTVCNLLIDFEYSIIFNRLLLSNICYFLNIIENFLLWGVIIFLSE